VVDELVSRGYTVNALSHHRSVRGESDAVRAVNGDLFDAKALDEGMRDCEAVIHLVGIIMEKRGRGITFQRTHVEGTQAVVDAAKRNGIQRYVHMSALGARPGAVSTYHRTKFAAEQHVRASGLDWTIIRPSLIHGPRGEFMQMEAKWSRFSAPPFLFMPYFGAGMLGFGGAGKLQPVYVKDVARAFVDALSNRKTIGEVYPLGGSDRVTWPDLHRIASTAITGKRRRSFPIPAWSAKIQAALLPNALLGFNRDQVIMSQEDNTCDITKFIDDFGWEPQPFETSLRSYASQI
jgi:NADH dehydrogenase